MRCIEVVVYITVLVQTVSGARWWGGVNEQRASFD